jgi:phosphate transport system substrate-binding protein
MSFRLVQNAEGEFVKASPEAVTQAAAARRQYAADFRVSITNASGAGAYPISSFTWILLYETPKDTARAKAMVDFMNWALTTARSSPRARLRPACRRAWSRSSRQRSKKIKVS